VRLGALAHVGLVGAFHNSRPSSPVGAVRHPRPVAGSSRGRPHILGAHAPYGTLAPRAGAGRHGVPFRNRGPSPAYGPLPTGGSCGEQWKTRQIATAPGGCP
jgi:hypothetical protein